VNDLLENKSHFKSDPKRANENKEIRRKKWILGKMFSSHSIEHSFSLTTIIEHSEIESLSNWPAINSCLDDPIV
jgi:hypothetical protein